MRMSEISPAELQRQSVDRSLGVRAPEDDAGSTEVIVGASTLPELSSYGTDDESTAFMRQSLETLIRLIERVSPGMRGTVLLLDEDGVTLRHGAAPSMPAAYTALIDGERIGPAAGSCGTAAFRRERVIVRDIATDPLWDNYRAAAAPFGLAACWSTPIVARDDRLLGTFAMYYDEPREPTEADIGLTDVAALLAANIIYRARAVTTLRAREEQFRALAESLPQLAWMADAKGFIYWYNQRWYDYTGTTLDEMKGWGWKTVHHPEHVDRVVARIQRSWDTGEPWEDTFPLRGRDGGYRWFLSRAVPIRDANGNVVRWFGSNTDITELREAELARDRALEEARRERQRLYEVFMQAPAAITVLEGPGHVFAMANARYRELVGGRDVVGKTVRDALPELGEQGFYKLLDDVYASGRPLTALEQIVRLDRDGDGVAEDFHVDFVYQPLKNAAGETFGILVHAVEVTAQVRARTEIAAARAEAERANRSKSEFLAAMSHDLRTPLNAIAGYADLVKDAVYGPVTEGQSQAMTRIQRAQSHLLTLINDILSFAKIEAGRIKLEIVDLSVNEVLQGVVPLIELQAAGKGLRFVVAPASDGLRARADRERTVQILLNLLTNAVKFTKTGSVTLEAQAEAEKVRISVQDTGIGIPAGMLDRVFEPFVQASRTDDEQRHGVGLGLATSRELARAMGGELSLESTVGRGSTFTLTLPRATDS